jgi:hypothetical protein
MPQCHVHSEPGMRSHLSTLAFSPSISYPGQETLSVLAWVLRERKWDLAKLILANCETIKVHHCLLSVGSHLHVFAPQQIHDFTINESYPPAIRNEMVSSLAFPPSEELIQLPSFPDRRTIDTRNRGFVFSQRFKVPM